MNKLLAISAMPLLMATGCASIVSESTYPVNISSTPSNVPFIVSDENGKAVHTGHTPAVVQLKSGDGFFSAANYLVDFDSPEHGKKTAYIDAKLDPWYYGNIVFGGFVGAGIVDPLTGAMWELPENKNVSLVPGQPKVEAFSMK